MQTEFHLLYVPFFFDHSVRISKRYTEKLLLRRQYLLRRLPLGINGQVEAQGTGCRFILSLQVTLASVQFLVAMVPFHKDVLRLMHLLSHTFLVLEDIQCMGLSHVP